MAQATLLTQRGARIVDRAELDRVTVPAPTGSWYPLPHGQVLDTVTTALGEAGFAVRRTQLAVSRGGARFFGTLDLEASLDQGIHLAVGVRSSIDKSFPIAFCVGSRVLVCDNLCFSGEITVARKHTKRGADNFRLGIAAATRSLQSFRQAESARSARFKNLEISYTQARALILTAYEKEIISQRLLSTVLQH